MLSTLIAITYEKTFRGLSYSRNFVQVLILSSVVAATVMQAIGDSLARGPVCLAHWQLFGSEPISETQEILSSCLQASRQVFL
ncbi:hypothetical protein KsCSTR_22010 [Candidatus Kuenenia stuttgartiensis]|uniref:Uncharacterized protein n=1 Tax=Kuenenia stuttgartiensis TaxID=174633 RepID=Q1Q386_KUEST|nr:hypothetical protein KsCSTR_22010 [Candidatus Kuenenia stuttgartiensis]CAJ74481.1 unknown protein [Candidatus Kuenenia stuttgartiensis]